MSAQKSDWKTYRSRHHGFQIDVPSDWLPKRRLLGGDRNPTLRGSPPETLSFVVGRLRSVPTLEETERQFRRHASVRRLRNVEIGRIRVLGEEHVWARYVMQPGIWVKKYFIIADGSEYAATAFLCREDEGPSVRSARESLYDQTVKTFRLDR
jgi:hypothetical protein